MHLKCTLCNRLYAQVIAYVILTQEFEHVNTYFAA